MKFIHAIGEQKLEYKEFSNKLQHLVLKYDAGIVCGATLQLLSFIYLARDNNKEDFLEACSSIFDETKDIFSINTELDEKHEL